MLPELKRFRSLCCLYFLWKDSVARTALALDETLPLPAFTELVTQARDRLLNAVFINWFSLWRAEPVGKQLCREVTSWRSQEQNEHLRFTGGKQDAFSFAP